MPRKERMIPLGKAPENVAEELAKLIGRRLRGLADSPPYTRTPESYELEKGLRKKRNEIVDKLVE